MKAKLLNFEHKEIKDIKLSEDLFGLEVRQDLIKRVIDWQLAKRRAGTHSVKTVGEVSGSNKKPFKQKGTGNARQGNKRGVQRRGGGVAHGPQVRSHEINLQKKVRSLGLRHALSAKFANGDVFFVENCKMPTPKTKDLTLNLSKFGNNSFFIIDGNEVDANLRLSSRSLHKINVVPAIGANVYDIIRNDKIIITSDALDLLEKRLSNG